MKPHTYGRRDTRKLAHYFRSKRTPGAARTRLEVMPFGEFLVQNRAITRTQLLVALQLQDLAPRRRIGECIAFLGFLSYTMLRGYLERWNNLQVVHV